MFLDAHSVLIEIKIDKKREYIHGMRGVVYKKVFDIFASEDYFRDLEITDYQSVGASRHYNYSLARVLLVLLYKPKETRKDRILFHEAEYIELKELFSLVQDFMTLQDFVNMLDRLYAIRDEDYWNHLITFDNVESYSKNKLTKYLKTSEHTKDKEMFVCITPAGTMFLTKVCVHFEYFSVRFVREQHFSLFEYNCFEKENDKNTVSRIIQIVLESVSECRKCLKDYDLKVRKKVRSSDYKTIMASPYYINHYHIEELCFHHVQYLNVYRRYMLNMNANNIAANKMLVNYISDFLNLLITRNRSLDYTNKFISPHAAAVYNKLMVCVEMIKNSDYRNVSINITTDYYDDHFKNQDCELKKKGLRIF